MPSSRHLRARFSVKCDFCFRQCEIPPSGRGWCAVRVNRGGAIRSLQGHRLAALAIDPVEKKPLHHFLPGSLTLSLAQCGCSFDCDFCQNADIAKALVAGEEASPPSIVTLALEKDLPSISFTYTEPLVWQDYMIPVAEAAHEAGLRTVMVTNGAFSPASLERLLPLIDAYNIDLKGFSPAFYEACGGAPGSLDAVRATVERLAAEPGCHLEVTTLVVPGMNDAEDEVDAIARWLASLPGDSLAAVPGTSPPRPWPPCAASPTSPAATSPTSTSATAEREGLPRTRRRAPTRDGPRRGSSAAPRGRRAPRPRPGAARRPGPRTAAARSARPRRQGP